MLVMEVWQPGCIEVDILHKKYSTLTAIDYLTPLGSKDKQGDT